MDLQPQKSRIPENVTDAILSLSEVFHEPARIACNSSLHTAQRALAIGQLVHCRDEAINTVLDFLKEDPEVGNFAERTVQLREFF